MHNFIIEFQDAFTPHYCDELIQKFEGSSAHHPGRTGAGVDRQKKDSIDLALSSLPEWNDDCTHINGVVSKAVAHYAQMFPLIVTGAISPSIEDAKTGEPKTLEHSDVGKLNMNQLQGITNAIYRFDDINMQRYTKGVGGYHHWHSEQYPHPTEVEQRPLHRVLLWLAYLNDVEEGGETEFLYQETKVKPKKGSLVLAPCGFTHTHRGAIPVSNDKYVLASWVMYKDAASLYGSS